MFGQLVPCGGGNPIPLAMRRGVVGRTTECDITLPYPTVSSKHCLLEFRDGVWFVSDLASRNGIRVDDKKCQEAQLLPGSILSVGGHRFQIDYALKTTAAPATTAPRKPAGAAATSSAPVNRPASPEPRPAGPRLSQPVQKPTPSLGELIPCGGGAPIPSRKTSLIIGRSSSCDITLAYPTISSRHCQLEFKEGYWHVRDLGSRNGIRIDGVFQVSKYVKPGEILSIATYRFEVAYTPQAEEPPPEENPFALGLLEQAGLVGHGKDVMSRLPQAKDDEPQQKRWSID